MHRTPHVHILTSLMILAAGLSVGTAHAHGAEESGTVLHTGTDYESCYIDLHEELTEGDFRLFSRQFADAGAFLPMSGARSLGAGHFAFGLNYNQTFLDDSTPQWNHTFSHPDEDHWLGSPVLPTIQGRVGISERLDGELMLTGDPASNWAIAGLGARRLMVRESNAVPVSLSARATYVHLLGADELNHESASVEVLASRSFGWFTPYVGGGAVGSLATEDTIELDLDSAFAFGGRGTVGAEVALGHIRISAQGMLASVPSLAGMVSGAF